MTPQIQIVFLVIIVVGINISTSTEVVNDFEETIKTERYTDDEKDTSQVHGESSEDTEALTSKEKDDSEQMERKPHKREQQYSSQLYSPIQSELELKTNPKPKTLAVHYPREAPYPKEAPYPSISSTTGQVHGYRKDSSEPSLVSNSPSMPPVEIDIRRAVPFENDYLYRHYASKFHYPPSTLGDNPNAISGLYNVVPQLLSPADMYPNIAERLKAYYDRTSALLPSKVSSSQNTLDGLSRFQNPFQDEPSQPFFIPGPLVDFANTRSADPPGFIPWTPPGFEHLQQLSPLDRFASAQPPSIGFNVEVSEIGEPAFIVPDNIEKVSINLPPAAEPVRTHGLSINDAQITRNEVRKDNGEFLSRYVTADGTERVDSGSLVPTADGDQVLVLRGSYSFTSPEGLRFRVDYTADETGYHATQVPVPSNDESS